MFPINSKRKETVITSISRVGNDDNSQIYIVVSILKCAQAGARFFIKPWFFYAWFAFLFWIWFHCTRFGGICFLKQLQPPASPGFCPEEKAKPCGKTYMAQFAQLSRSQLPSLQSEKAKPGMSVCGRHSWQYIQSHSQLCRHVGRAYWNSSSERGELHCVLTWFPLTYPPLHLSPIILMPNVIVIILLIKYILILLNPKSFHWITSGEGSWLRLQGSDYCSMPRSTKMHRTLLK